MTSPDRPTIPTSTADMLERTRRRAEQLRRRRRAALSSVAAVVVAIAVAVPLLSHAGHHTRIVGVTDQPTSVTTAATTPVTTAPTTPVASTVPSTTVPTKVGPSTTGLSTPSTSPHAASTTTPAAIASCASNQLRASLTNPSGAAGSVGYDLGFVNIGGTTCSLIGYPGVSYVTGSGGTIVGAPAQRDAVSPVVKVTLAPGHAARATLIEVDSLNYPTDTCQLTAVNGLRIYPPNQTAALFVPQSLMACANPADSVLQIGPVQAS